MKIYPHLLRFFCLLIFLAPVFAQDQARQKPQIPIIKTESKILTGKLFINEQQFVELKGNAIFQVTTCHMDGSFSGIFTYEINEASRRKIAKLSKHDIENVSVTVEQKEVTAEFAKGSLCPVLTLEFAAINLPVEDAKLHLNKFSLKLKETNEEVSRLICKIAENLAHPRGARLPCRRINEIFKGVEPQ